MKQPIIAGYLNALNSSTTEYNFVSSGLTWNSTENVRHQVISTPGTISKLRVELDAAPGAGAGDAYVFTLRVNGAGSTLTCTITQPATSGSDLTHEVTVSAGDTVSLECAPSNTPSATPNAQWSMLFEGDNANESLLLGRLSLPWDSRYTGLTGSSWSDATENEVRQICPTSGTIKNLYISQNINAGGVGDGYTYTVRKNGANTTLTCSTTNAETTANDTTHSFTVAAGDVLTIHGQEDGTADNNVTTAFGCTFLADTNGESIIMFTPIDDLSSSTTEYNRVSGDYGVWDTTEANLQQLSQECVLKNFYVQLETAPSSGDDYTFTVRVNAASPGSGLVVQISDTDTTGNDTSNTVSVSDGDNLTMMVVPNSNPDVGQVYWGIVCYIAPAGEILSLDETLNLVDITAIKSTTKSLTEALDLVGITATKAISKTVSETLHLVDITATFAQTLNRTMTEALHLTGSVTKDIVKTALTETLHLVDITATIASGFTRSLTETLNLVDEGITKAITLTKTETLNLVEITALFGQTLSRTMTEALHLTGSHTKAITKAALTEVMNLTDDIVIGFGKTLTETLQLTDSIAKAITKTLTSTLELTDTAGKQIVKVALTEVVELTDTIAKAITKTLTETMNLVDSVSDEVRKVRILTSL
jgi:hypothetical protein